MGQIWAEETGKNLVGNIPDVAFNVNKFLTDFIVSICVYTEKYRKKSYQWCFYIQIAHLDQVLYIAMLNTRNLILLITKCSSQQFM